MLLVHIHLEPIDFWHTHIPDPHHLPEEYFLLTITIVKNNPKIKVKKQIILTGI
jgi:hypothetical protein